MIKSKHYHLLYMYNPDFICIYFQYILHENTSNIVVQLALMLHSRKVLSWIPDVESHCVEFVCPSCVCVGSLWVL